jgi:tetratricopeptide (TPR) repeat protein
VTSLNNLAELYRGQADYSKAEPLYNQALAIQEKSSGPSDPHLTTILNNLALLHIAQGNCTAAEPLCKRMLAILENALGPDDLKVADCLEKCAALLHQAQREQEAQELESRAKSIRAEHGEQK